MKRKKGKGRVTGKGKWKIRIQRKKRNMRHSYMEKSKNVRKEIGNWKEGEAKNRKNGTKKERKDEK